MTKRELIKRFEQVNEKVWYYYHKIYSEDSNDVFDAEHDALYYHIQGFNETLEELFEEAETTESDTNGWADSWKRSLEEEELFIEELEAYYNAVVNAKPPNYIYG